jgi:hypothetical protein
LPRLGIRLAAAIALVLLGVASLGAFIAINQYTHHSVPVHPAPFKIKSPGSAVCFSGCYVGEVTFVSASVGFVLEQTAATCSASCSPQTTVLFRTTDAGLHWRQLTTLRVDCCLGPRVPGLIASRDGNQLLLFGYSNNSTVLLYSSDAGLNWTRHGLPEGAGPPLVNFIDPRDGWVVAQEQSFNIADLYRTTNAGASWTLVGKIDVDKQFGLGLANGKPLGNQLFGQFMFSGGDAAWFVAQSSCISDLRSKAWGRNSVFRSVDGGLNWAPIDLVTPTGLTGSGSIVLSLNLFNSRQGVLELVVNPRSCDPQSGYTVVERRFVYTTADGGTNWSTPIAIPQPSLYAEMRYVDPQHWFGWPAGGGWMSTSDAGRHWIVVHSAAQFGDRPAAGQGLPTQLPDNYPLTDQFGFVDSAHGWALPYQTSGDANARGVALYLTSDAGLTWRPTSLPELA